MGVEERTVTTMEVDSIIAKVATKNILGAPNTTKATTKTMHPSTMSTIIEIKEGTKNLQLGDGSGSYSNGKINSFFGKNKIVLLDFEDEIQNRREDNVNARKIYRLVLKSCKFLPKIKLY